MTAKEKSQELFDKFFSITMNLNLVDGGRDRAKQCALIAVDEILENQPPMREADKYLIDPRNRGNRLVVKYWESVKSEIEKL